MGGQTKSAPGKTSAYEPDTITRDLRSPGKATLVPDYVKDGAVCDEDPSRPGCSLAPDERQRLVHRIDGRIRDAADQYRDALRKVQFEAMLEKDDDLPWAIGLLLDAIGLHVAGALSDVISQVRSGSLARLDNALLEAGVRGEASAGSSFIERLMRSLRPERVQKSIKSGVDASKRLASNRMKQLANAGGKAGRSGRIDYLEALQAESAIGWAALRENAPAAATDAELLAMVDAFAMDRHVSPIYQAALKLKLQAFESLHLERVGRQPAFMGGFAGADVDDGFHGRGGAPIARDVRLVWIVYRSGRPRQLAFQHQDRARGNGAEWAPHARPPVFGENRYPYGSVPMGSPTLGRSPSDMTYQVQAEFVEVALARHREVWGADPIEYVLDDIQIGRMTLSDIKKPATPPPATSRPSPTPVPAPSVPPHDTQIPPDFNLMDALKDVAAKKGQP